ncbi:phosphoenolpyruvate synthase [Lachnospiraceae bacterium oral taxon 500]|nr:phosphoenolpyruvate synthase [Lachnospiraceae bacterium oral taxon 500]
MILDLKDIKKEDVLTAGGKGANLGEMISAGINVPAGFVITAEAYREFIRQNKIAEMISTGAQEAGADEDKLLALAADIRAKIKSGGFPVETEKEIRKKYASLGVNVRVAVRSSATAEDLPEASFAGQQETYLNVRGIEDVLAQIRHCYASLWGDRAVSYRFHQGYAQAAVAIAVVIQEMVESEKAGVLFTINPVSQNTNEMQINASYGLGESVVSGQVTADSYIISKLGKLLDIRIGSKASQIVYAPSGVRTEAVSAAKSKERVLNEDEIDRLVKIGLEIEQHYGRPMDIEWAMKENEVYILQARAVTALKTDDQEKIVQKYIKGIKLTGSMKKIMAFQLEKMPFAYRALDFDYIIAINEQKARIFAEGGIILDSSPKMDADGIQTFSDRKTGVNRKIFHIFKLLKMFKNLEYCCQVCTEFMARYEREIEAIKSLRFESMELSECQVFMEHSYALIQSLAYDRFKYALFPAGLASRRFTKIIKRVDKNYSAFDFYWGLNNKTAVVAKDISAMAEKFKTDSTLKDAILSGAKFDGLWESFPEFKRLTDDFLKKNGFKSDYNCYCLEAKTFREDPDRIVNIIRPILETEEPAAGKAENRDYAELMEKLKHIYGNQYPALEKNINFFRYFHVVREESQYLWETVFYYVRQCVRRINQLLLGSEDYRHGVANLFHRELMPSLEAGYLNADCQEIIRRRDEKSALAAKVWEASKLLVFDRNGPVLKGVSGSGGSAVGKACVIRGPKEFYKMKKGDILVCHLTDPEWTPLFKLAGAVVADTGSALSHAAIVAREYNIPAVLGVGFATARFKDGDRIWVDGEKGEVRGE